ncbi:hypothetical protein [Haloarcula laminariae]|uniref:hypothetical protein n=1 Tax=Haloarcula laminariae TaxID=2961577 RepID=UPI00240569AF|nr:hypothetical protein [Halomicroarcula sp. FL173]
MSTDSSDEPTEGSPWHAQMLGWTGDLRWATIERPVGVVVILFALVPFWILGGLAGVLAWLAIAGSWLLFPPVVPVVFGQFLLAALTPVGVSLTSVLPAEAALCAVLAASFIDSGAWLPTDSTVVARRQNMADAVGYLGAVLAVGALVVYLVQVPRPLVAGGLCLGLLALVAFVLRPVLPE